MSDAWEGFPRRVLPDGRMLAVVPLTFGRGRLIWTVSARSTLYEDGW